MKKTQFSIITFSYRKRILDEHKLLCEGKKQSNWQFCLNFDWLKKNLCACRTFVKIFCRPPTHPRGSLPFPAVSVWRKLDLFPHLEAIKILNELGILWLLWSRAQGSQRMERWDLKPFCPSQELYQKSRNFPRYRKIHRWIKMVSEWNGNDFYSLQTCKLQQTASKLLWKGPVLQLA